MGARITYSIHAIPLSKQIKLYNSILIDMFAR